MDELTTEWKYKGKFLKMGIKQYRLPGDDHIRVRFVDLPNDQLYEIIERINKEDHNIRTPDGFCYCSLFLVRSKYSPNLQIIK